MSYSGSSVSLAVDSAAPVAPPEDAFDRSKRLYHAGQYVQAYRAAAALGRAETWPGSHGRVFASRLLTHVGAFRRAQWLLLTAYRSHRRDPEVLHHYAHQVLGSRGPLACWELARRHGELAGAPPDLEADWHLVRAEALAGLRDFTSAEALLARARVLDPESSWADVVHAGLLEAQDRRDEALRVAQAGLARRPFYRPAVQQVAVLLSQLGRDDEALELLGAADARLESMVIAQQRGTLELELGRLEAARRSFLRVAELAPAAELVVFQSLSAQLAEVAYRAGDAAEAARCFRLAPSPLLRELGDRLLAAPVCRRVMLPVKFVRQHHLTCAPATLAAISSAWGMVADHLEVAEEICYDGTPARSERRWAERSGFVTREFTVTWEAAVALLERGIPFTLTMVEAGFAHLVAVVGYDPFRRGLMFRDPSAHWVREADADAFLARYAATGPRGMVLVPRAEAARLVGLELPDAAAYDQLHALEVALDAHDREAAATHKDTLDRLAPDHRLAVRAALTLAAYDADPLAMLDAVRRARAVYPDDVNLLLAECAQLSQLERVGELRALLEVAAGKPGAHPLVQLALAEQLADDAREHDRLHWLVHLAHLAGPGDGRGLVVSARAHWLAGERDEAVTRWRLGAGMADMDEARAWTCSQALASVQGADASLSYLRGRVARFGARSGAPAITLARGLIQLDRAPEVMDVLEDGMRRRSTDADLMLEAAQTCARLARDERAGELLEAARSGSQPGRWLRVAARLARTSGDRTTAVARWRDVLEREPLATDAHDELAELLSLTDGPTAAVAHMRAVVERFPHHQGLLRIFARRLVEVDRVEAVERLRSSLSTHGDDVWCRRELALCLAALERFDEARAELARVHELEPRNPASWMVLYWVERRAARPASAAAALRQALALAPAHVEPIFHLAALASTPAEQRELLELVRGLDDGRGVPGNAVLALVESGASAWFPTDVLELARAAARRRTDDADAAAAVISLALETAQKDDALGEARRAVEAWPMRARAWLDLARVHLARREESEARAALERARHLDGGMLAAVHQLARMELGAARPEAALALLDDAARRAPEDVDTQLALARLGHDRGAPGAALDRVLACLRQVPDHAAAWSLALRWSEALGRRAETVELARGLARRPHPAAEACVALATLLGHDASAGPDAIAEAFAALDRAIAQAPLATDAYDQRAILLTTAGRHDEAIAACSPPAWPGQPPVPLRGRAVWVRAQRGDVPGAIADMEALLAEVPWYDWGLIQLNRWCHQRGQSGPLMRLGPALAASRPSDAQLCLLLADAHQAGKDAAGAERWLHRALAIDPRQPAAAQRLFDACFARHEYDEAAAFLARCDPDDPFAAARDVQLRLHWGDVHAALASFDRTCEHTGEDSWPVDTAARALDVRGRAREVLEVLDAQVRRERPVPVVLARSWALFLMALSWAPVVWYRLARLRARGEAGVHATVLYLERLRAPGWLLLFMATFRRTLRASTGMWSAVSYALLNVRQYRLARWWLRDWRERDGLEPYMLMNVVVAARALGDDAVAARASRRALALEPDHCSDRHRRWLALDAALEGDAELALGLLEECTSGDDLQPFEALLQRIVNILCQLHRPSQEPIAERARTARAELGAAMAPPRIGGRVVGQALRRAARAVRDVDPGPASWWWWLTR